MKRTAVFIAIVGAALLAGGCGSKATITGTVTYKGKPISDGYIVFVPDSGAPPANAFIKDGKYTAEKVPTGPAKVTVTSQYVRETTNPRAKTGGMGAAPEDMIRKMPKGGISADAPIPPGARAMLERRAASSNKGLQIPDRYSDPAQSGLTYTVQSGAQTKDFNLD